MQNRLKGEPQQLEGQVVSAEFFRVLGVRPLLGRDFRPAYERAGARVTISSCALWQSTFGGAPDIVGRAIHLGWPEPCCRGSHAGGLRLSHPEFRAGFVDVAARLKPGVTLVQALAELSAIARNIAAQYPDTNKPYTAAFIRPMLEHLAGGFRPALRLLFGAVVLVLLIACANVAGLLLAPRAAVGKSQCAAHWAPAAAKSCARF